MTQLTTLPIASPIEQTDYLKLLMQELSYQDPLKPMDNREFMAQMAQFSTLQESRTTNESLQILTTMMSANQGLMLLGKQVKIKNSDQEGRVTKIQFPENASPLLQIAMNDGALREIKLTEISSVWEHP